MGIEITKEQAIERLKAELEDYTPFIEKFEGAKSDCEALDMAIKSMDKLEQIEQIIESRDGFYLYDNLPPFQQIKEVLEKE